MVSEKTSWQVVDPEAKLFTCQYRVANFISRSNAFPTASGQWVIVSPSAEKLELPGTVIKDVPDSETVPCLVLPNAFHFLGYAAWKKKFPRAQGYAPEGALGRLTRKGCGDLKPLAELKGLLPPGVSVVELPGLRYGEAWFRFSHAGESTWVTGDVFFNLKRFSRQPFARLTQKLLGSAPGLKLPATIKYVLIKDRKAFLSCLEKLLRKDKPTRLLPLHGEILSGPDLPQKLTALLRERLGAKF